MKILDLNQRKSHSQKNCYKFSWECEEKENRNLWLNVGKVGTWGKWNYECGDRDNGAMKRFWVTEKNLLAVSFFLLFIYLHEIERRTKGEKKVQ